MKKKLLSDFLLIVYFVYNSNFLYAAQPESVILVSKKLQLGTRAKQVGIVLPKNTINILKQAKSNLFCKQGKYTKKQLKKEMSKLVAQQCRKKKKTYIQKLEAKVDDLNDQLEISKKRIKELEKEKDRLLDQEQLVARDEIEKNVSEDSTKWLLELELYGCHDQ